MDQNEFMNMCELVFTEECQWPAATPEITAQRQAVFEAFSRDQGWTLCPIECSGGKSTMARIYTMLDVDRRWVVAVKTIADCKDFVDGFEKYQKLYAEGPARRRTVAAAHSEMSFPERMHVAGQADVLVICHASLQNAMSNPPFAKAMGMNDRKLVIDEEISMVSHRNHSDRDLRRFITKFRRWQDEERNRQADGQWWEDLNQDLNDMEWANKVITENEDQETFVEGYLAYSARSDTDGKLFPRVMGEAVRRYLTCYLGEFTDETFAQKEKQWNEIVAVCASVVNNLGLAVKTHDDDKAEAYGRVFEGRSIIPADWTQAVVLDGTAQVRPRLAQTEENPLGDLVACDSYVQKVGRIRDYSNVIVDIIDDSLTSAKRIMKNHRGATHWVKDIVANALDSEESTFILGSKDQVKEIALDSDGLLTWDHNWQMGMDKGSHRPDQAKLNLGYWNRHHRGTNDFMGCTRGFTISLLNKPYWCAALPVLVARGGTGDLDDFNMAVSQEKLGALAAETIQGINRIKHRGLLVEDGVLKTPSSRFTVAVHNTPRVPCLDGVQRNFAELLVWLLEHEMPGVQVNHVSRADSAWIPGIGRIQQSSGQRGAGKKYENLLDHLQLALETEKEIIIEDNLLKSLCPTLKDRKDLKRPKQQLAKETIPSGLGIRGMAVTAKILRGKGIQVSKAA